MPLPADPTVLLRALFVALSVVMAGGFVGAVRYVGGPAGRIAAIVAVWMGLTAGLAGAGLLAHFDPPRVLPLFLVAFGTTVYFSRTDLGGALANSLPLVVLVGFQSFRIVVEIGIHLAGTEGVAPMILSWSGWNFDIATGVSALVLVPFVNKLPRVALLAWNTAGLLLVLAVVAVAVMATPGPMNVLLTEPANIWVSHFPFVWLPIVLVQSAVLGHLLVFRRLLEEGQGSNPRPR